MSKFRVGDWVVRKPEERNSWWIKKCQLNYCIDPAAPIKIHHNREGSLDFGRGVGWWGGKNFTLAHDPNISINLDDYL